MPKKKLPFKKKSETKQTKAQEWIEKIQNAIKVKEKWREGFRVSTGYEYWEGRQRPANIPGSEWVTINLIYSNLQAMLPSLYNTNPYFYVKLKKSYQPNPMMIALYEQRARIRQSMLNYLKEELELKPKTRLSILDAMFQFGVCKVHHTAELIENPDAGKPILDEATGTTMLDDAGEPLIEPEELPAEEAYKLTRVHPDDFVVDEDAGPLDGDVTWKAQRIKEKLNDVKQNKNYKKSARDNVKATEISDQIQRDREQKKKGAVFASTDSKSDADIVVSWEIWDLKNKQWFVVSEGYDDFMKDPDDIPNGIQGDPFVDLRFTLRDDSWYPIPPVSQWIDPQKEYCEARSKLSVHRKRFNRKYLAVKGWIEPNEVSKIEIGDDGTVAWQQQPGAPAVLPIPDAPLDQTLIQELNMLREELTVLAIGPNQRGSGRGVESATEADIIEKRLQIQEGDWIGLVVDFVQAIAEKMDQQVQANITRDQAVKVSGPQGEYWELVRKDDYQEIEGEYEYSVNVGQMTPRLPEIERSQWMAFLNLLASAPQLATNKRLVKHMAELHHIDDEVMVEELYQMAMKMMGGQMPMSGQQGSMPGSPAMPGTASAGMAT